MNKLLYAIMVFHIISCTEKKPLVGVTVSEPILVDSGMLKGTFTILNKGSADLVIENFEIGSHHLRLKERKAHTGSRFSSYSF